MSTKALTAGILIAVALVTGATAVYMVDVDQTQEAKLPDVDVKVEDGQLPGFKVQTGSVDVGTEETTVSVPDVDIKTVEKDVTVPTVEITPAPAD